MAAFVRNSYVSVWPKPLDLPPMQVPPLVPAGDAFHLRQEKARPGVLKDGSPATGKYTVGIRKGDAEKLKVVARQHHLELSRLLVGVPPPQRWLPQSQGRGLTRVEINGDSGVNNRPHSTEMEVVIPGSLL